MNKKAKLIQRPNSPIGSSASTALVPDPSNNCRGFQLFSNKYIMINSDSGENSDVSKNLTADNVHLTGVLSPPAPHGLTLRPSVRFCRLPEHLGNAPAKADPLIESIVRVLTRTQEVDRTYRNISKICKTIDSD